MSVDFIAFDAQLTGTNGAAGSAGGTIDGGDGGNAIESLPPFSNTDFSLEPSLARVFPTATAGNGGAGAGGANATATTLALQGGIGGKGGAAFVTMDHDILGSAATPYIGFVTITMSVDAAAIGSAGGDSGGAGGAGGRGGLGITVVTGVNGSQDSRGSDGAIGGAGGIGEVANADLTAMTSYATSDLQIQLISNGGKGGQGGFGGSGGNGSLSAGNGADGAQAGAGAPAEATFSGATAFNDSAIFVTEKPTGGFGGSGGNGGNGGNLGTVGSPPTGFGANGNGGAGGAGGGASATVSGDTLTAPSVQFTLNADGGQGGKGGLGGNAGAAPGLNGAAGSDGAGSITFTNNVITVGSGIPGDTQLSGSDLLLLNLRVATIGPAGFFLPGTLNGGVGGNLAFSGNMFIGDGASRLVLQLGSTGTAVVDTIANTISIDGSATSNTISGFTKFTLDTNDVFVAGGGNYQVTFAADPDTLVVTPNSGNVTLAGITSTNFLLDFRGFSPSFDAVALAADTNASSGSTVITLSPTSTITLQGYTGGIASGAVIFEPLPTVVTETASVVAGGVKTGTAGTAGTGALAGDSDLSGYSLAISAISGGALGVSTAGKYGHLTLNADGSYSYSADISDAISGAASGSQPIDTFTFTVSDGRGGTINSTLKFTIDNAPPVTTAPANEIASKGTPFAFRGANLISVADFDALSGPGETITVILTDTTGLLSAFVNGASGGAILTGNGTQQLTISGGLGQVNAALGTLSFLSNSVGPDQIDVATSDGRGGSDDLKIAVTVTPSTNVPFSIIAPSAAVLGVNQPGSLGIKLAESPTTSGETFSISISDANGALSASTLVAGGGGTIVNSGANTLTISGTLDQVNADLTTLTETNTSTAPDLLFMLASNSNGENAPVVLVDVTVNGAPTITTPSDIRAPAGLATPVPLMKVSEAGNTAGEVFVVILSDVNGLLSATLGGSPVTGSGTNHLTLSGSLDQVNAQLASLTITETAVGLDFITGGVGDGFGNGSGQFMIPVVGEKTWTSTVAGDPNNWNNAANWTTPGAPVAGQDIFIPAAGPQPIIFDGASGLIGGTVTNNGTITLGSIGAQTALFVDGNVVLEGTGSVVLSDSASNVIESTNRVDSVLDNWQTISGAGSIAVVPTGGTSAALTFHNDATGIVNATGANGLGFVTHDFFPGLVINEGLMEASGVGGLFLDAVTIVNNGMIEANNGSHIDLDAVISGGTLSTTGSGVIRSISSSGIVFPMLDGSSNGPLTNLGRIEVNAGNRLTIAGTIKNDGTISVLGTATQAATLLIDLDTTLQGTGSILLSNSASNLIVSTNRGDLVFDNQQTISGAGSITVVSTGSTSAALTFHNDATGIVNATGTNGLVFVTHDFVPGMVINDGLMEATGAGGLIFDAVTIKNDGMIEANNGSHIDLDAVFSGGTLSTTGSGVIRSISTSGILVPTLDGSSNGALTNLGKIEIDGGNSLAISGTINNNGTINLLGDATQSATLVIEQNATLQGTGSLVLSDSASNMIESSSNVDSVLDNRQTIVGAGSIVVAPVGGTAGASLTFHNDATGIVNATGSNALLFVTHDFASGLVINDGLMEATGVGGLSLAGVFVSNTGTVAANSGSHVDLGNDTTISGGTLSTTGTGVIRTVGNDINSAFGPRLDGSIDPLVNAGTVEIDGNTSLAITGTINNNGTVKLAGGSAQPATLLVEFSATLRGNGSVVLSDSSSNIITGRNSDISSLDNQQTIAGAGFINVSSDVGRFLSLLNDTTGIINATGFNALVINGQPSIFGPAQVTNDGLMEATGTGGLVFNNTSIANNNGLIEAFSGSHVDFVNSQLSGAGGLLFIDPNASVTFSNASAASGQTIQFLNGTNETLVLDDATISSTAIGAHISGFAIGDQIDLTQLKVTGATIDGNARLHLFSGTTEIGSLQLDSSNLAERFVVTGDGGTGTLLTIGVSTPPQVTESLANDTGAQDGITNDPSLAGTGNAFAVVSLSEDGVNLGTTVADATGAWHFTPTNLSQGSHTVIASETNAAGTGHASLAFIYDSVAPSVAITTPDALVANPQLSLSGTGEAGTQVQLFDNNSSTGGLVTVDATGHWSEQITLVGTGTHFITASDTDLAGNLGSSAVSTFALDNQIVAPINQLNVAGTTGADHITISQSNILVRAGAGNDTITLTPGGNFQFHFLNGGPGNDTLDLSQIAGNVTANLTQDTLVGSQIGFSVLNSIENIIAGSGNERLIGSSGANVFQAGAGTDTITGHGGGDTFVFKPGFGKAVITDFHVATTNANPHDFIELDQSLFSQFATIQALLGSSEVAQQGSSVVIMADAGHTIELQHTSLKTLVAHANDLLFV